MTTERDILAQRLVTKHSEKALQKQVSRQQIEINTLQDKLQDVTSDRDRLAGELANAQQLAADLRGEVDFVRAQKTAQEHELRAAIARLQRELHQARIDLEAERQVPRSEIAISDAAFAGFNKGKTWAFREVCDWLRPFVGADAKDAAALLDAVPGLVKRLAQCEGVEI
jgi:seryl-tRNA synthetase